MRTAPLVFALLIACSPAGTTTVTPPPAPPPPAVAAVTVTLPTNPLNVGAVEVALVVVKDASGSTLTGRATTWSSSAPAVATIDMQTGLITALAAGSSTISASSEAVQGSALLTVNVPAVASVTVTPTNPSVIIGATVQFAASTRDSHGNVLNNRPVVWSTGNAAVATVSQTGLATALGIGGPITITAMSEGIPGTSSVTVTPFAFGAGTYFVGTAVPAGRYRSINPVVTNCYWARLSGFGGSLAEILANDNASGPAVVDIAASDKGFTSSGCASWVAVVGPITSSLTAPFGPGAFIVGTDVAAGTWSAAAGFSGCYWQRSKTFSGLLSDIITNSFGPTPALVTISATDVEFYSSGCGNWVRVP